MVKQDDDLNVEQLALLKKVFEEADEDGSGELDMEEFITKLGPHLGNHLTRDQVAQLFMKIDADAGGTVDWDEFTNYMFLEKTEVLSDGAVESWRLMPQDFKDKNLSCNNHHDQVDKLYHCSVVDKYISCGRDGTFRVWNASDLLHVKTVHNGNSWITDCVYMNMSRKLVFTTMDRAISFYDINRGAYELVGRVYTSGTMGVPLCLNLLSGDNGERIIYGDTLGATCLLLCGTRELPPRDLISTDNHKDYIYLHREHKDWVTKVEWIPEVGLVTSSLDTTMKTYDIHRERMLLTCTHHKKGIHDFVWCKAYSCFASCGLEREVIVWQGNTGRKMGALLGHTAPVMQVALDDTTNHLYTLSLDRVIKVWDLRSHKCLQTINQDSWEKSEHSKPTCCLYDSHRKRLVTMTARPYAWMNKVITQGKAGHRKPIRGALYNKTFHVIITVDEGGMVCVWNMRDGSREGRFCNAHGTSKVTAMTLDKNQRRLITCANDGTVKMWNFNNGSLLRQYVHDQEALEIASVLFAADEKRGSDSIYGAGWNCKVFMWEDCDEDVVKEYKAFEGHKDDITHICAYPAKQLLASADYQGLVIVWHLQSGEKKLSFKYTSHVAGNSVQKLHWLPAQAKKTWLGSGASGNHGFSRSRSPPLGFSGLSPGVAAGSRSGAREGCTNIKAEDNVDGHISNPAAGMSTMMVKQQSFLKCTSFSVSRSMTTSADGQAERTLSQRSMSMLREGAGSHPGGSSTSHTPASQDFKHLLLLTAGEDGLLCIWAIGHVATMVGSLDAAHGGHEQVTAICNCSAYHHLVIGDSGGHVRIWNVADGVDVSGPQQCARSFVQVSHWVASDSPITTVDVIGQGPLLVVGTKEGTVAVWTFGGALVGYLRKDTWDLAGPQRGEQEATTCGRRHAGGGGGSQR